MSLIGTISSYSKLTPEQKAFVKNKGTNESMSAHKWVRFFEPLCRFDQQCDAARSSAGKYALILVFVTFFSVFFSGMFQSGIPFFISASLLATFSVLYFMLKGKDINNNVRNTLFPLLNVLSLELGNRQKISIKMNFQKGLKKRDIVKTPRSDRANVFYAYDILELNCALKDGTKLTWKVRDLVRKRTKRNPRGKIKVKLKLKRRILISLGFRKTNYRLLPDAARKLGKNIKETDSKIVYKNTVKQTAQGKVADVDFEALLKQTRVPYKYITQA